MSDEYWKQERKLNIEQTTLIYDLAKELAKRLKEQPEMKTQGVIEIGITEFLFARAVEFGIYQKPNSQGESHEPVADTRTPGT